MLCVCIHVHVLECLFVHVYGGQRWMTCIFLNHSPLANQQVPGFSCPCLSSIRIAGTQQSIQPPLAVCTCE